MLFKLPEIKDWESTRLIALWQRGQLEQNEDLQQRVVHTAFHRHPIDSIPEHIVNEKKVKAGTTEAGLSARVAYNLWFTFGMLEDFRLRYWLGSSLEPSIEVPVHSIDEIIPELTPLIELLDDPAREFWTENILARLQGFPSTTIYDTLVQEGRLLEFNPRWIQDTVCQAMHILRKLYVVNQYPDAEFQAMLQHYPVEQQRQLAEIREKIYSETKQQVAQVQIWNQNNLLTGK